MTITLQHVHSCPNPHKSKRNKK